jgi:cobalamin biosynthesis protein CobD/CbiB
MTREELEKQMDEARAAVPWVFGRDIDDLRANRIQVGI